MDQKERIEAFEDNLRDYFTVALAQREEIRRSFAYMDCYNVMSEDVFDTSVGRFGRQNENRKRHVNICLLPAIVRGVAGSEAMQQRHIDIVPIDDEQYDVDGDIMDDAVSYAQYASGWKGRFDARKRDAAICGIGGVVYNLDMTKRDNISGTPKGRRIYPGFLFYDTSGRGQDLNETANWCGYADPMRIKDLEEYIKSKLGEEVSPESSGSFAYSDQFMVGMHRTEMQIDMLYHRFWRENETVRDTENIINTDPDFKELMGQDDVAVEFMGEWAQKINVDVQAPFWILDKEQYGELKKTIEAIGKHTGKEFKIKSSPREVKCYYRAEYALGREVSYSKSYSQNEYELSFVTGYFDEGLGIFYGFTRPLSFVQDAFNIVMDDLLEMSHDSVTGGKAWIKGAGDDLKALKMSKANEDDLTPLPRDAEITPKALASSPQLLLSVAQMLIDLMPRSIGVGPEFLGIISSGDMTDSLFGRVVKQSFAVLQDFSISSVGASRRDGQLFLDMMTAVAKVENGRLLPVLSPGHQDADYKRMWQQNIARQYIIRVIERPVTDDERMENNKILMQLAQGVQSVGGNLIPAIVENTRMDHKTKEEVLKAIAPPPPQQPNPLDVESMKANIRMINAQAAKLEQEAAEKAKLVEARPHELQSEVYKNVAAALYSMAQAEALDKNATTDLINSINAIGATQ